ncbi:glycosyltransferase, partial [Chloroflexota bacterium]
MKILITSIVDLRKSAHNRLHRFIKYLSQNHEITVLSVDDRWKAKQTDLTLYAEGLEDILHNVKIEYFTQRKISPIYQELSSVFTLRNILDRIGYRQFDVHFNYGGLVSGYSVAKKVRSAGVKTVFDIADDLPAMIRTSPQMPTLLRPIGGLFGKMMLKKNVALAERITIITESLRHSLQTPPSKTSVVPNGVDTDMLKNHFLPQLKNDLGLGELFVLGFVGTLREWVDLETVFVAVGELNGIGYNIKVLIVGEEGGVDRHKALAQRYGISDSVVFTGTVPYSHVPKYISCMDVCLLPFKADAVSQNSLPLKLFEYMACEKPVISIRLNGVVEAVNDRVKYFSNKDELKLGIIELYGNEELRKNMGVEGREFAQQNYSWR